MKFLILMALSLTMTSAFAESTCQIKEVKDVTNHKYHTVETYRVVSNVNLDECIDIARDLLGKTVTGSYRYRVGSSRSRRYRVDENAIFKTVKVKAKYQGDDMPGETIIAKFKER